MRPACASSDNRFGADVLAAGIPSPLPMTHRCSVTSTPFFHDAAVKPSIPWPASRGLIARRRHDAAFEQAVLDRVGRGPERFLPGDEAANIHQPALLLVVPAGCRDRSQCAGAVRCAHAAGAQVMLDGCGHMSIDGASRCVAAAVTALIETPSRQRISQNHEPRLALVLAALALAACRPAQAPTSRPPPRRPRRRNRRRRRSASSSTRSTPAQLGLRAAHGEELVLMHPTARSPRASPQYEEAKVKAERARDSGAWPACGSTRASR
jgi:hypothetical protein